MTVAAVIVHWNSMHCLPGCLRALRAERDLRVVVVDNASPDDGERQIVREFPEVRWHSLGRNAGFGAGVNAGARLVGSRWVLALNPDVVVGPGTIGAMAAWADAAGAVAVGPLIYGQYGRLERSWETRDSVIGDIARHLAFRFERRRRPPPKPLEVAWLTGACLLVRRDVFEAAGGFDERFFLYYEDADLCRRLRASEGRLFVHPGFAVQHQRGASARQGAVQVQAAYRSSQLEYVSRYRHAWQVALVRRQVAALATRWERSRGGVEVREGAAALRAALARTAEPR